ncbi:serine/threonine-protein kinase [Streptomyces sp. NPDC059161]|uniref:serine/threonine-protein kinase n=1 Tax=Streptomyces sp. NPDC059161 TaxID=3346749 RepID=UPI0036777E6B
MAKPDVRLPVNTTAGGGVEGTEGQLEGQPALAKQGPLPVEQAAVVAAKMLEALGAAHQAGIVHRDVKPANVMMASDGEVLLADFGIAVHHADTTLTSTGAVIGSVECMAPERACGTDGLAAGDLFSLGVTLHQAVEGVSPFRRGTPTGCLAAVLFEEAAPSERAGRLAPLITGLLEKDPDRASGRPGGSCPAADARVGRVGRTGNSNLAGRSLRSRCNPRRPPHHAVASRKRRRRVHRQGRPDTNTASEGAAVARGPVDRGMRGSRRRTEMAVLGGSRTQGRLRSSAPGPRYVPAEPSGDQRCDAR